MAPTQKNNAQNVASKKKRSKYKKCPNAPKRSKSAFIFFSTEKHSEIRNELKAKGVHEKTTNVAKLVSEAWKNLSADDRVKWEEMAKADKERYEAEKATYQGPWKISVSDASTKDPNAPKRPMSAFLAYSNSRRAALKRTNPSLSNADVSRNLSKKWKELPDEERQTYIDEEKELREKYKIAMKEWREKAEEREQLEQQQQQEEAEKQSALVSNHANSAAAAQILQQQSNGMSAGNAMSINAMNGMNIGSMNAAGMNTMAAGMYGTTAAGLSDGNINSLMASAQGMNQFGATTNPFSQLAGQGAGSQQLSQLQQSYPMSNFDGMASLLGGTGAYSSAASAYNNPSSMYQSALLASMQPNQQQVGLSQHSDSALLAALQQKQNQQQLQQVGLPQHSDSALLAAMQQQQNQQQLQQVGLPQQPGMQNLSDSALLAAMQQQQNQQQLQQQQLQAGLPQQQPSMQNLSAFESVLGQGGQ